MAARSEVTTTRVPDGGIEPQAAVDAKSTIHLVYFKGSDKAGDLFYSTTADGKTFTPAKQINSQKGSAMAIGSVRGVQMALGREGRIHVAWMGSHLAEPKAPGNATPLLYTRLGLDGAFELQLNIISKQVGLDGGPSIAADDAGHVLIAWHAPSRANAGEADRRIWLARSINDGGAFQPEMQVAGQGICACCGLKIAIDPDGKLFGVFRQAKERTHRGTVYFGYGMLGNQSFEREIAPMESGKCIMSTFALAQTAEQRVLGYETDGDVFLSLVPKINADRMKEISVGKGKHPSIAINAMGDICVVQAVGTGWARGGTIAWQVFDSAGKSLDGQSGTANNLPAWSYPAVVARPDGNFMVFY